MRKSSLFCGRLCQFPLYRTLAVSALVFTATTMMSAISQGAYEGSAFGVENYADCAPGSNLSWTIDKAQHVRDALAGLSYTSLNTSTDYYVDGRDFIDNNQGGSDNVATTGTDWADVAFFSGHGGYHCGPTAAERYTWIVMGDDVDGCTPLISSNMVFGEGGDNEDLNYFITDACHTAELCAFWAGVFFSLDGGGSGAQLGFYGGWHGSIFDESTDPDMYAAYVDGAEFNGVGDDFLDLSDVPSGADNDECATPIAFCETSEQCYYDIMERGGFKDMNSSGTHYQSWNRYICNCDPLYGDNTPFC